MYLPNSKGYDKYLFDITDYKHIGKGKEEGYRTIRIVENINDKKKYVNKTNKALDSTRYKSYISREIHILIRIQHPTIVPFLGFSYVDFNNKTNSTILMDFMENGDLSSYIEKTKQGKKHVNYLILKNK